MQRLKPQHTCNFEDRDPKKMVQCYTILDPIRPDPDIFLFSAELT